MKNQLLFVLIILSFIFAKDVEIPLDSIKGPTCVILDTTTATPIPFAPERSKYNVVVSDGLAELTVSQMFVNRFETASSIAYIFPLPHEGSVNAMKMYHDDSIYISKIYDKDIADSIFDSLENEGKSAALLIQERPNIFQQKIANIAPGDTTFIEVQVSLPLNYADSIYELRIPTMVAPRYQSGKASRSPWNPPADVKGTELSINVLLQTGFAITQLESPTHPITISQAESNRPELDKINLLDKNEQLTQLENRCAILTNSETYPNKDYVLRFKRSNAKTDVSLATYFDKTKNSGYFAMNIFPDETLAEDTIRSPREILIMFDISGSQGGWPIQKQKEVVNHILDRLSPNDRLAVMAFNGSQYWAFNAFEVREANETNIQIARNFINNQNASGGTNLYGAIDNYLKMPTKDEMSRYFVFLTDGFITNEEAIFERIENDPSEPTIFTYGAGGSLNHYFLEKCAEIGNGLSVALTASESALDAVDKSWEKLTSPQLDNISVEYGTLNATDIIMTPGKKLYKGMPITCFGRYSNGGTQKLEVTGYRNGNPLTFEREATFANGATPHRMIPKLWAKQMIEKLDMEDGTTETNKDTIVSLSVEYQVLSKYTAFLAVDAEEANDDNMVDTSWNTAVMPLSQIKKGLQIQTIPGSLQIQLPEGSGITGLTIVDLRGRIIFQQSFSQQNLTIFNWDGRGTNGQLIANGAYILRLHTNKGAITTKFNWFQ